MSATANSFDSPIRVFKHPFEVVMLVFNEIVPQTAELPVLLSSKEIASSTSSDGCATMTEREIVAMAPLLLQQISGLSSLKFRQVNLLDRKQRTFSTELKNISFSDQPAECSFKVSSFFYPHPHHSEWTCFSQSAAFNFVDFFGFEKKLPFVIGSYGFMLNTKISCILQQGIQKKQEAAGIRPGEAAFLPEEPSEVPSTTSIKKAEPED